MNPFKNKKVTEQPITLEPIDQANYEFLQQLNEQYSNSCKKIGDDDLKLTLLKEQNRNTFFQANQLKAQLDAQFEKKYGKFTVGPDGQLYKAQS